MLKTITLTANTVTAVDLMGGCHAKIENRGTATIYVSKSDDVAAGTDGTMAVSASATKYMKDVASYTKTGDTFDYFGTIYIVSSEDGIAEIETGNYFFNEKNSVKGGGGDIPSDVYTKDEIDTKLASKVGKADYPSNSKTGNSGAVKTDPNFGIYTSQADYGDVTKGLIYINKATAAEINAGTNNYKPIVPSNLSVAMSKYGIDNNTIANMNVEIDGKVDNDVFVADNMIKFPYYSDSDSEFVRGIKRTINSDGSVTFNGISTANTTNFYCVYEQQIKSGTYTLSGVPNIDGLQLRFNIVGATNYDLNGGTESLTFTIESDTTFNLYPRATKANVVCDNAVFYPMLEKGSVAHDYQPYKLSRQSLRDDVNDIQTDVDNIQTDITDIQADVDDKIDDVLNLIPYPYTDNDGNKREETYSENGLTFNFSKNGILVNGTNEHTGNTNVTFCSNILLKANKTYTLSGCGNKSRTRIRIGRTSGGAALYEATYNNPITFTPTQDELCNIYISIGNGETLNSVIYNPMLEYGSVAHEFEEYQPGGLKDVVRNADIKINKLQADIDALVALSL